MAANGDFCFIIPTANTTGIRGPCHVSLLPTEAMNQTGASASKRREGARGMPKVKSGCRTCKTRRKKCDEMKPACSRCIQGGWHCDFLFVPIHERTAEASTVLGIVEAYIPRLGQENVIASWTDTSHVGPPGRISVLPSHLRNLNGLQAGLFDYFRAVCAPEFSLYFLSDDWERLILQTIYSEPWALKATLSISTLSRSHYSPGQTNLLGASPFEYAMVCYNQAIANLNNTLGTSVNGSYLAVIGAILFVTIEFLQQTPASGIYRTGGIARGYIQAHIQGGLAILRNAQTQDDLGYLTQALILLQYQEEQFQLFLEASGLGTEK